MNPKPENTVAPNSKKDKEGYIKLYQDYHKKLCLFALKFLGDLESAEDIVHDVFISLWENYFNFDFADQKQIERYLFRSVRNNCVAHLKKNSNQRSHREVIFQELMDLYTDYNDHILDIELKEKIEGVVKKLPEKSRNIFMLSRYEGMKNRQIAEKLDLTEKSIEYHITKTLKLLKEKLVHYVAAILLLLKLIS